MIEVVTSVSLWQLIKHAGTWLTNLKRARLTRKQESREALQKVILAARTTGVYVRTLKRTGEPVHDHESTIAELWTGLGFSLETLGIDKLAKHCHSIGRYWGDPEKLDPLFLEKAAPGLKRIEQTAREILAELE